MPKILIIDCSTGEEIVREMTKKEIAHYQTVDQVEATPE